MTNHEALVASADLSNEQFAVFKEQEQAQSQIESLNTEETEVAAIALPIIFYKLGKAILFTLISGEVLSRTTTSQGLVDNIRDSGADIFWTPVDDDLFADTNVERFPAGEGDAPTSTPPFDLGELGNAREINSEQFPSGNKFLEDILNGQFEFPDAEEGGSYFLTADTGIPEGIDIEETSQISSDREIHILDGDASGGGGHRAGTGIPGKTEFPAEWSDEVVLDNIIEVVKDPNSTWTQRTGSPGAEFTRKGRPVRWRVEGTVDGIDIRVTVEPAGQGVVTAFPTNTPPNP